MNIKDEQFKNLRKYSDYSGLPECSPERVALYFARILADIVKRKVSDNDEALWNSVPQISADAKRFDIVKDFSIREHDTRNFHGVDVGGQVGVVTEVREIRKRDGRTAVSVEIVFFNHTTLDYARHRKIEFIKG